jgi:hypothetical protein
LCDLRGHKIYYLVMGLSERALEPYLERLERKQQVQVCVWTWPRAIGRWCASISRTPASWPTVFMCAALAPRFLRAVHELRQAGLPPLVTLRQTLHDWREEIASMWRFSRNNGITEGFHTKMEMLQRQAFGLRNFENYRLRVKVMCS